jgi:hypothetical protein
MSEAEVLSFWPNRVPNQVRFPNGEIDNYCDQCGKPINRFIPNGDRGSWKRYPEHDLQCDARDFVIAAGRATPEQEAEFYEYMRSKKVIAR